MSKHIKSKTKLKDGQNDVNGTPSFYLTAILTNYV